MTPTAFIAATEREMLTKTDANQVAIEWIEHVLDHLKGKNANDPVHLENISALLRSKHYLKTYGPVIAEVSD